MEAPRSTVIVALRSLGLAVGFVTSLMVLLGYLSGGKGPEGWELLIVAALVSFWPLLISAGLLGPFWWGKRWGKRWGKSRSVLLLSMILYLAWFLYAYFSSFHGSSDGQAALVFLVVGFFAFPVMAPLWGVAAWLHWRTTRRE